MSNINILVVICSVWITTLILLSYTFWFKKKKKKKKRERERGTPTNPTSPVTCLVYEPTALPTLQPTTNPSSEQIRPCGIKVKKKKSEKVLFPFLRPWSFKNDAHKKLFLFPSNFSFPIQKFEFTFSLLKIQ